jgi:hypothetical protein
MMEIDKMGAIDLVDEAPVMVGDIVIFHRALPHITRNEIVLGRVKSVSESGKFVRVNNITRSVQSRHDRDSKMQKLNAPHLLEKEKVFKYPLPVKDINNFPIELLRDALFIKDFAEKLGLNKTPREYVITDFMGNALIEGDIIYYAYNTNLLLGKICWKEDLGWFLEFSNEGGSGSGKLPMHDVPPYSLALYPFNDEKRREHFRNMTMDEAIRLIEKTDVSYLKAVR